MLRKLKADVLAGLDRKVGALLLVTLVLAGSSSFIGVHRLLRPSKQPAVAQQSDTARSLPMVKLAGSLPTVAHPLPAFAKQMTLASATSELGTSIILPNSALAPTSDVGPVWVAGLEDQQTGNSTTTVAVTFPVHGVVLEYTWPAPSDGSAAHFQAMAQSMISPSGAQAGQLITLSSHTPALAVQENADETGTNFGEIIFNAGGTEIRVMGHAPEATLQGLAQAILAQSRS